MKQAEDLRVKTGDIKILTLIKLVLKQRKKEVDFKLNFVCRLDCEGVLAGSVDAEL